MKKLLTACLAFLLVVALAAPVWADFDAGMAAYNREDYATALKEWRPLAEQGNAKAQHNLGVMYQNGMGVPQDYKKALDYFQKAAEQGYELAQYDLGFMYVVGVGVPLDLKKAAYWYQKAAERGYSHAQFNLGTMYYLGQGVPKDLSQAYMWLSLAAAQGHQGAINKRDTLAKKMTPAQIAEAKRLAKEWKPKKPTK